MSGINPEFFRAAGQNSPCLPQINASDNSGSVFSFNNSGSIPYMNGSIFHCRPINGNSIIRLTDSDISQQTYVCQLNIIAVDKENPRIAGYPFNDSSTSYPKFRIVNLDTDNKNPSMNPPTPHHVPLRHRFLFIYIFTSNAILNYGGFFFLFLMVLRPDLFPWIGVQGFLNGKKVTIVEIVLKYLTDIPLPNHEVWVHPTMHEQC